MPEESRSLRGDADLIERFRDGDQTAFDELVRLYQKDVRRVAYRLTGDADEADDIAQETFLRAYGALGRFRGDASLRTWLIRIAANLSLNIVQSARVALRNPGNVEELAPHVPTQADVALIESERMSRLGPAIAALPPRQRATLMLRVEGGLMFREIAKMMGCTVGTAKANFFHAVANLRRAMKERA